MDKTISIIIPTYHEKDNIVPLIKQLHAAMSGYKYEVLFIDDNSNDGTAEAVESLSKDFPVRVIVRKDKRGLASAVVDGFGFAKSDILAVMDADLQHPPEVMPELAKAIEGGADLVIGSRYVKGGGCQGWSLTRRIISKGAVFLAHLCLPSTHTINDPMSGLFILQRKVIEGAKLNPTGYKILLEILGMGNSSKVVEVPYMFRVRERGESKLNAKQQIDYLKHLYSLMKRKGELIRFVKFCLVGGSGVLVNEGLLWVLKEFGRLPLLLSSAIAIEASIISNFMLNDYFTFRDRRSVGKRSFFRRLGKFNLISLVGVGLNMGILWLLTVVFGIHYLLSNLVGIAFATLWNYFANQRWTWK